VALRVQSIRLPYHVLERVSTDSLSRKSLYSAINVLLSSDQLFFRRFHFSRHRRPWLACRTRHCHSEPIKVRARSTVAIPCELARTGYRSDLVFFTCRANCRFDSANSVPQATTTH